MTRIIALAFGLAFAVFVTAGGATAQDTGAISETTLSNGMHVVLKEAHAWPVASVDIVIKAGSLYEDSYPAGTARMVAQLLFEADKGPSKLRPLLSRLGGYVSTSADKDAVQVSFTAYKYAIKPALELLAGGMFGSTFTDGDLAHARLVAQQMQSAVQDDPYALLDGMIWSLSCGAHPYGAPLAGTADTLERISTADLNSFYQKFYVPGGISIVAVGDLQPEAFFQQMEALFGAQPRSDPQWQAPVMPPVATSPQIKAAVFDSPASFVGFGWRGPGIANRREVCAMDLIYALLKPGSRSLLAPKLQPSGADPLALEWKVEYVTHKQAAPFEILVATEDEGLGARQAVLETVAGLRDELVSAEDLNAAKATITAEYTFQNEAYDEQATTMAFYEAIDGYKFATEYLGQINTITPQDIQEVARKYLTADGYSLGLLSPGAASGTQEAMLP